MGFVSIVSILDCISSLYLARSGLTPFNDTASGLLPLLHRPGCDKSGPILPAKYRPDLVRKKTANHTKKAPGQISPSAFFSVLRFPAVCGRGKQGVRALSAVLASSYYPWSQ